MLDEVARLRRENEELSERLAAYRSAVVPTAILPPEWGLKRGERLALLALYRSPNGFRTTEQLFTVIAGPDCVHGRNLVSVRIRALRRKLARYGIRIETVWGEGYQLTAGRQVIADEVAHLLRR